MDTWKLFVPLAAAGLVMAGCDNPTGEPSPPPAVGCDAGDLLEGDPYPRCQSDPEDIDIDITVPHVKPTGAAGTRAPIIIKPPTTKKR